MATYVRLFTLAENALAEYRTPALDDSNYETTGVCVCLCSKGGDITEPNAYTEMCIDPMCRCHTECWTCHGLTVRPYSIARGATDCAVCYPTDGRTHCRCGAKTDNINRSGADTCPVCHTFSTDHTFRGSDDSDWRCYDCDARYSSHR